MCHRTRYVFGCRHASYTTNWHDCYSYSKYHDNVTFTEHVPLCSSCKLDLISHQAYNGDDDSVFTGHTGYSSNSGHSYYTHGRTYDELHVNVRHRSTRRGGSSHVRVRVR